MRHADLDSPERGFSSYLSSRTNIRIEITPDQAVIDPNYVEDVWKQFLQACNEYGLDHRKLNCDATELSVPVIRTPAIAPDDRKIFMLWDGPVPEEDRMLWHMPSYLKWTALRESFIQSGVSVVSRYISKESRNFGLSLDATWVRDLCLVIDDTAYFPDRNCLSPNSDHHTDIERRLNIGQDMMSQLGLKIVSLSGVYFEGGNLIEDKSEKQIFWGNLDKEVPRKKRKILADAIYKHQGRKYEIVPVTSKLPVFHTDLALSDELPDRRFLLNSTWMGAQRIRESLSPDRIILLGEAELSNCECNLVVAGGSLFMTDCNSALRNKLQGLGYTINAAPINDNKDQVPYRKMGGKYGGGVHCLAQQFCDPR